MIFDRLFPHRKAYELIVLWETTVKPDLLRAIAEFPDDKTDNVKATLKAFIDFVENRMVVNAVRGSLKAEGPPPKFVQKAR